MKNNNFDLRKFLTENKLTTNSKVAKEEEMFDGVHGINIDDSIPSSKTAGISIYVLESSSGADTYYFGILDGEDNKKIISVEVGGGPVNVDDIEKGVVPHEVASDIVDYINDEVKSLEEVKEGDFAVPTNEESKPIREYSDDDDEQEWREEFPEAIKYSWEWDDEGVEAVNGHIDNLFSRGAPDISKEEAMEMMGRPDDETKKAFNQAFITQMQETDDTGGQYDDYQYTINLLYAYEKTYGEPFNTNLIKFLSPYKDAKPKTYDEYREYVSNLLGKEISEGSKNFDLKKFLTENKLTSNSKK